MISRTCWPLLSFGLFVVLPVVMMATAAGPAGAQGAYKPHHPINPKNPQVYFDRSSYVAYSVTVRSIRMESRKSPMCGWSTD